MTTLSQNIEMWAGDYKDLIVTITGSDGAGYDLTGASITWVLEEAPASGSLIKKQISGSGVVISTSTVTISLSPADTSGLAGMYYHEAEALDSASRVSTLFVGTLKIHKSGANN